MDQAQELPAPLKRFGRGKVEAFYVEAELAELEADLGITPPALRAGAGRAEAVAHYKDRVAAVKARLAELRQILPDR